MSELTGQQEANVLDLACGNGRHMKWLHAQGIKALGVDRDSQCLELCRPFGEVMQADLELPIAPANEQPNGSNQESNNKCYTFEEGDSSLGKLGKFGKLAGATPSYWPLGARQFNAVIVTNYLWRPLFPHLINSLVDSGVLIYETFAQGHEALGRPSRPEFLLKPGELLQICSNLRVIAYEEVLLSEPDRFVQRIVAIRSPKEVSILQRYRPTSR